MDDTALIDLEEALAAGIFAGGYMSESDTASSDGLFTFATVYELKLV